MASKAEAVMVAVLARLQGSPSIADNVRRAHRIPVTREQAPAVHLIDGTDTPTPAKNNCLTQRTRGFTVSIFVRDDAGASAADSYVLAVNAALDPEDNAPYPSNAVMRQGRITVDEEIADGDAVRVDMAFEFDYVTSGWALDA
jgi:hypothetical protein